MTAFDKRAGGRGCRRWNLGLAALALACGGVAWAQVVSVPAAHLHHAEGSVAHAPQGDKEWQDVQPRRLLKRGDRLWTDRGSRAEVQAAGHALRLNGETQMVLENVSETAAQLSLTQGSLVATVTRMNPGDSFEVGTPNLAFRARQPGDYRIDVDTRQGVTRIVVASGAGVVYGEKGEALEVRNGQRVTFRDRSLTRVQQPAFAATDDFDRWAGARRRGEPTVSMPVVAAAAAPAPAPALPDSRKTIVIPGGLAVAAAKPVPAPAAQPAAAAPVAPVAPVAAAPVPAVKPMQPAAPMRVTIPAPSAPVAAAPAAAAEAKRAEERRQANALAHARRDAEQKRMAARRVEEDRRVAAKREQEQKKLAAKRAEEDRRQAIARRAADDRRIAAARQAEAQKLAEQARRRQLVRLQEQAHREEQTVQARREQAARRADEERREEQFRREEQARREEMARREDMARREEQARREEEYRRQRAFEQARREQERREQEVWLRQQQLQPVRPAPMGVPARRVS